MMEYLTITEAADLARISPKRLRNLMADGTLREGVHFTRPRGLGPRFRRETFLEWLEGRDQGSDCLAIASRRKRQRGKLDLSLC